MQGGGVAVYGSADFTGCNIFNNEVTIEVCARFLHLLDPSSSARWNVTRSSIAVRLRLKWWLDVLWKQWSNSLHFKLPKPSSSAPLERGMPTFLGRAVASPSPPTPLQISTSVKSAETWLLFMEGELLFMAMRTSLIARLQTTRLVNG